MIRTFKKIRKKVINKSGQGIKDELSGTYAMLRGNIARLYLSDHPMNKKTNLRLSGNTGESGASRSLWL